MKEYKYTGKKRIVNNKKYNAIIPDEHSTINALILETRDLNAWDDYANITDYHTLCMIQKKGDRGWQVLYDGATRDFKLNGVSMSGIGFFNVLFQLEKETVRNKIIKTNEIKKLRNRIKNDTKRIKELQ